MVAPSSDSTVFESRDQSLVLILIALGHEVKKFDKRNGIVTVFFDKTKTKEAVDSFYGNHPIPLKDARMFIVAQSIFRSMIKEANE